MFTVSWMVKFWVFRPASGKDWIGWFLFSCYKHEHFLNLSKTLVAHKSDTKEHGD